MVSIDVLKIVVETIKSLQEKERKWSNTFDEMLDGRFVPMIYESTYNAFDKIIEKVYNDKDSVFSWWVWECDFGKTAKMWDKDKTPIPMKTIEDLYNYYCKYTLKDENE